VARAVEDEYVFVAVHQLGDSREGELQSFGRRGRVGLAASLVVGEHDGPAGRIEAVGQHSARLTRLPVEDGIAVQRVDHDIGVDHTGTLRFERVERCRQPPLLGKELGRRFGDHRPFGLLSRQALAAE